MRKEFLFCMTALLMAFSACSGGDDDPTSSKKEDVPALTIDSSVTTNGLSFTSEAGENSITFTASDAWTLSVAATRDGSTWCTPSQTSGTAGTVTVNFTVTANDSYDDRSVAVTIRCGTISKNFSITQKAVDALLLTTDRYEVPQAGGTIEVEVKSNISYDMEIAASAKDWIKEASTRGLTARNYKFNIAASGEMEKREGEIYFKSGDKVETVKVYQAGGPILLLSQNEITVSDEGETITVELSSNVDYSVEMPSVGWITEAATRGMSSHTVKFTVQPNTDYDSRTAQIIFSEKNGSLKDTLTITQAQKDAIVLTKKEYLLYENGGSIEIEVSANIDYIFTSDASWIQEEASTRGLQTKKHKFTVAALTDGNSRTGRITVSNVEKNLSETVTIRQEPTYVTMDQTEIKVLEGKEKQLTCSFHSSATDKALKWSSADESIATVTQSGVVKGIKKGEVTVTAATSDGVHTATCTVTVQDITDCISFSSGSSLIQIGSWVQKSVSSTITNNSDYPIELVKFTVKHPDTMAVINYTTDPELLGTLQPGESRSLTLSNLTENIDPIFVWEYIFEGTRYANHEAMGGEGSDETPGGTVDNMPWTRIVKE